MWVIYLPISYLNSVKYNLTVFRRVLTWELMLLRPLTVSVLAQLGNIYIYIYVYIYTTGNYWHPPPRWRSPGNVGCIDIIWAYVYIYISGYQIHVVILLWNLSHMLFISHATSQQTTKSDKSQSVTKYWLMQSAAKRCHNSCKVLTLLHFSFYLIVCIHAY